MVYYTIADVGILGQVKKKALAGTPTTAIFLAAILYEQVFLYLNVNLFHYKSTPRRAFSPIVCKVLGALRGIHKM